MLLSMVIVVLIIAIAMLFAILSSFLPFSNAYWNIIQYTSAYYSAISAIERWCLAVRYAGPGFDWESWWKFDKSDDGHYNTWNSSDSWIEDFVSYWRDWDTTLYWSVKSKTSSIPKKWGWNVDPSFIDSSSNSRSVDYNVMDYHSTVLIPLWKIWVIQPTNYYSEYWNYWLDSNFKGIRAHFRINPYLFKKVFDGNGKNIDLAKLCVKSCPWSSDDSMDRWTPYVDWVIKWLYEEDWKNIEVSILPSDGSDVWSSYYVHEARDSLIRRNCIWQYNKDNTEWVNNDTHGEDKTYGIKWAEVIFWDNKHPLKTDLSSSKDTWRIHQLNIVSRKSESLKNINKGNFIDVISYLKKPQISFELINYLWSQWSWSSMKAHYLYPFLEYRVESLWWEFSDLFYTIKWEWRVWKYDVRLQIKKPTLEDSSLWNFTIIF